MTYVVPKKTDAMFGKANPQNFLIRAVFADSITSFGFVQNPEIS